MLTITVTNMDQTHFCQGSGVCKKKPRETRVYVLRACRTDNMGFFLLRLFVSVSVKLIVVEMI